MVGVSTLTLPALAEPVKLTIWGLDGDNGLIPALAKEFDDKNDDVVVEFRAIAFDELVNEALKAFATNHQAPDIICLDNPDFALFSSRGAMLDITDRVAASGVIKTDVYYEGPLASAMWDGKLYGVPKATNTIALFYNKDLFAKAGIAEPPTTWDHSSKMRASSTIRPAMSMASPGRRAPTRKAPSSSCPDSDGWRQLKQVNTPGAVKAAGSLEDHARREAWQPGRPQSGPMGLHRHLQRRQCRHGDFGAVGVGPHGRRRQVRLGRGPAAHRNRGGCTLFGHGRLRLGDLCIHQAPRRMVPGAIEYFVAQSDRLFRNSPTSRRVATFRCPRPAMPRRTPRWPSSRNS